jgi:hypothetical protein
VELNTASFPAQQPLPIVGEKLHQVFHMVLENLVKVMDGYCLTEPYFSNKVWASTYCSAAHTNRGVARFQVDIIIIVKQIIRSHNAPKKCFIFSGTT